MQQVRRGHHVLRADPPLAPPGQEVRPLRKPEDPKGSFHLFGADPQDRDRSSQRTEAPGARKPCWIAPPCLPLRASSRREPRLFL